MEFSSGYVLTHDVVLSLSHFHDVVQVQKLNVVIFVRKNTV